MSGSNVTLHESRWVPPGVRPRFAWRFHPELGVMRETVDPYPLAVAGLDGWWWLAPGCMASSSALAAAYGLDQVQKIRDAALEAARRLLAGGAGLNPALRVSTDRGELVWQEPGSNLPPLELVHLYRGVTWSPAEIDAMRGGTLNQQANSPGEQRGG
jgi:hypothetical protein